MLSPITISRLAVIGLLFISGSALAQTPTDSERARRTVLVRPPIREIPEATQPCTPDEAQWWQDLREAAKKLKLRRDGKKERQRFLDLLQMGQEKSYRPPVLDTKPLILSRFEPAYSGQARAERISGWVRLVVALRPDGFVGEVDVVSGIGYGLDENSADAARRTIFLPAIKDRKFVSYKVQMAMSFQTY